MTTLPTYHSLGTKKISAVPTLQDHVFGYNATTDRQDPVLITPNAGSTPAGTLGTGTTGVEHGGDANKRTILTVAGVLPAIAGGADLAVGLLLYTFPAGIIVVHDAFMSLGLTQSEGNVNADTPDGALGTVIGTGAVALLGGTATFEDIITGQTFNNCTGTAEVIALGPTAGAPFVIPAASAHTVHFNAADGWAASGDAALAVAGTVMLNWTRVTSS